MGSNSSWPSAWRSDLKLISAYWALFLAVALIEMCGPLRRFLAELLDRVGNVLGWRSRASPPSSSCFY
ncbi:hypothetical protein [Kineococcus sp. SYSU DK004]|uniref:hypothetical protein n=1 Tax=Kineococcus sp. SYSU DK004 TaxID=3383125 RepID=UPI003D7EB16C